MDKKALQEQFEAIAIQNCWNINKYPAGWDGHGDDEYVDDFVSGAWWGFQEQQAKLEELRKQAEIDSQLIQLLKKANKDLVIERDDLINKYNEYDKLLFQRNKDEQKLYDINEKHAAEKAELQKRVDAVKGLAQTLWEKSNEKHTQGKVWESKALGECADEILDVIEQALKGEG